MLNINIVIKWLKVQYTSIPCTIDGSIYSIFLRTANIIHIKVYNDKTIWHSFIIVIILIMSFDTETTAKERNMRVIKRNEREAEGEREQDIEQKKTVWITKKFNIVSHKSISVPFISSFSCSHWCFALFFFLPPPSHRCSRHCCHCHHIAVISIQRKRERKNKLMAKKEQPPPNCALRIRKAH